MAAVTGLTLVKVFTYRGDGTEEWSNTYHFKNPPPGNEASWTQLAQDVWNVERDALHQDTGLVTAYGYDSDDPSAHHVWMHDYTQPGPPPLGAHAYTGNKCAGDQAACVEWKTSRLNSRGKPIYLRKYLHVPETDPADKDRLSPSWISLLDIYGGVTSGMNLIHGGLRSRAHDETITTGHVIPWVTTRTLKRRGKRPKTGS
jgi:hypothetical protein